MQSIQFLMCCLIGYCANVCQTLAHRASGMMQMDKHVSLTLCSHGFEVKADSCNMYTYSIACTSYSSRLFRCQLVPIALLYISYEENYRSLYLDTHMPRQHITLMSNHITFASYLVITHKPPRVSCLL